jgi:hypothetical protein
VISLSGTSTSAVVASVGDPEGTRTITSIVALLVVLGVGLVMLAIWLFRVTRPDDELLAPLEVMGERKWRRADPVWQRRRLDEVRPEGAQPLQPSAAPPDLDEAFDQGPAASGFDDLHDDHVAATVTAVAPTGSDPDSDAAADRDPDDDPARDAVSEGDAEQGVESEIESPEPAAGSVGDGVPIATSQPQAPAAARPNRERVGPRKGTAPTPIGMARPGLDEFPDHELDPEIMAAAMADLDAELGLDHKRESP